MMDERRVRELLRLSVEAYGNGRALPPGIEDLAMLEAFEARRGVTVPSELRQWLQICNGPRLGPGGLFGIETPDEFDDLEARLLRHPEWRRRKWVPIAGDGCGDYYLVATTQEFGPGHPVFFVDQSDCETPDYLVASCVGKFLEFILEDELAHQVDDEETGWPFDEAFVRKRDPDIVDFHGAPLPWEANQ